MSSSKHFYVVSAHKASAVSLAVKGNFTGPNDLNLILAKGSNFEINLVAEDGLRKLLDVPLYGRIAVLELYRPAGRKTDLLFISTERYRFCVLSWDPDTSEIITEAMGDLVERTGRQADQGCAAAVDPKCRVIAVHAYQGILKIIPMLHAGNTKGWVSSRGTDSAASSAKGKAAVRERKMGELADVFNIRLDELQVHAMTFLQGDETQRPLLAVLCQDTKENRHVKTFEVSVPLKELVEGPWYQANVDSGARMLIPVPVASGGGLLVIGEKTISYMNGRIPPVVIGMKLTIIKSCAQIDADGSRYLLGDYLGNLFVLVSFKANGVISSLRLERLGETSIAAALTYLDNGYAYVGSHYGDSQLIKLSAEKQEAGDFFQVVDTYPNLAPIVDFAVVDLERQGQGQIVACSGIGKDGSLRIVRNGIGINEIAELEMTGLRSVWSLRPHAEAIHDDTIVLSFTNETRLLHADPEGEITETEDGGAMRMDESTLFAINMCGDCFIQITASGAYLLSTSDKMLNHSWSPPSGCRIIQASANSTQVLLALSGCHLVYLQVNQQSRVLEEVSTTQIEHEISCVDIAPLDSAVSNVCVVGLWGEGGVQVLALPSWNAIAKESLGEEVIPRSVHLATFDGVAYLLAALGDGTLYNFMMDATTGTLRDRRKISLGTQPVALRPFRGADGRNHIFAASDRPTVIYSSNQKLLYSNVNLKEVIHMTPFNLAAAPNALALATPDRLRIGTVDDIQKLHIRTIPLREFARRIAHDDAHRVFGLLTTRLEVDDAGTETERTFFKVLDDQTFDVIDVFELEQFEIPESISVMNFFNDPQPTFAIGTAYAFPNDEEPTRGRILLFRLTPNRRISLIAITEVPGSAYAIVSLQERLVASINSRVVVFSFDPTKDDITTRLTAKSSHHGHLVALYLAAHGHFLLVGDLMKSVSILRLGADDSLEEVSKDFATHWMTAVQMLDDETCIGGDSSYNILAWRKRSEGVTDDERQRLELIGEWHVGDQVNRFRHGSLVIQLPDSQPPAIPRFLFCTLTGTLGVICTLSDETFALLNQVEVNLRQVIKGVGGLDHAEYRSFMDDRRTGRGGGKNFIDGDFIERILELDATRLQRVVEGTGMDDTAKLGITSDALLRLVEDLNRLH
ncbi:hypothetical protein SmJEL517_g06115 [Synchytrium microbalum]|uniref:DNA damage-binding protein 1 n=1 Tax=Synchytrium microbalum TaxID=1806994 RepID=A0A507BS42_9FUNG|nr:uncharacterized protein SmJEL517_g06115 [Synchytrium microbalum]TPX30298.1 hypothetical protein SmJEL517_g06115 [Synchytrium microbalum]